jgi:hypothetical protein
VGLALSLVFIGGAFGKAACGWLGVRLGLLATVAATDVGTAGAIMSVLALPLLPSLSLLPILGVMLNGTSSVLYGTVPELVAANESSEPSLSFTRAFWDQARWLPCCTGDSVTLPDQSGRLLRQP